MRRFLGTAVAGLALAVLVGCSASGTDSGGAESGAGGGTVAEPVAGKPGEPAVDADRQVVTTATASLAVEDPADGAQRVSELVESVGGRVDERSEQAAAGDDGVEGAAADLVVRVPADALTGVLADLEALGDVENVSVSHSDVTAKTVDMDARISALQSSVARLQALMDGAATTEDLLTAEKALSERQEKLESMQSQRALLADQVELSTLTVQLRPFGVAPASRCRRRRPRRPAAVDGSRPAGGRGRAGAAAPGAAAGRGGDAGAATGVSRAATAPQAPERRVVTRDHDRHLADPPDCSDLTYADIGIHWDPWHEQRRRRTSSTRSPSRSAGRSSCCSGRVSGRSPTWPRSWG